MAISDGTLDWSWPGDVGLLPVKKITLRDRPGFQLRAEIFNLLKRANFNTPNLITFTPSGVSATAGATSSTSHLTADLIWTQVDLVVRLLLGPAAQSLRSDGVLAAFGHGAGQRSFFG